MLMVVVMVMVMVMVEVVVFEECGWLLWWKVVWCGSNGEDVDVDQEWMERGG